ncbi:MAG: FG-GAP-like repeat-containing protein, partial [Candidatus Zixiibacteriota bacterium]
MHGRRPGMLMITILLFGASSALKAQTPHVVGATPPPQTVSAPPNSDILLTFDTPLDPLTVSDTTVRVYGRWSGPSSGALTLENANTQVRFNPDEDFFYGEWITVALSKSVKSATGQPLASGYYSNFWTWTLKGTLDLEETGRVPVRLNGEGQVQTYGAYAGDFDDDGWSDLAVPNEISADMRVFHNDGAGDYGPFTIYDMPGSSSPSANEGADFDRDGAIDIAIGSGGNNQLTVFFGDGLGGFLASTNYTAGSSVRGVAVLDMDADGLDDIITANRNASTLTWFRNNGDRTFAGAVTIDPGGFGETACAAADANNDGIADL